MGQITNASILVLVDRRVDLFQSCAQVGWCIFVKLRFDWTLHIRVNLLSCQKLWWKHLEISFFFPIFIPDKRPNFADLIWNNLWYNLISSNTIKKSLVVIIFLKNIIFIAIRINHLSWLHLIISILFNIFKLLCNLINIETLFLLLLQFMVFLYLSVKQSLHFLYFFLFLSQFQLNCSYF